MVPVLELAFVPDVPVLVRGSALVPVLELAFVRDMPVLVRAKRGGGAQRDGGRAVAAARRLR